MTKHLDVARLEASIRELEEAISRHNAQTAPPDQEVGELLDALEALRRVRSMAIAARRQASKSAESE